MFTGDLISAIQPSEFTPGIGPSILASVLTPVRLAIFLSQSSILLP
jgi:hypothetical protein